MNSSLFKQQASYWGRVFEVAVQRGAIAYLLHRGLLSASHPHLQPWQTLKVSTLTQVLIRQLNITDPEAQTWAKSGVDHLLVMGYGLGWTTVREWLKPIKVDRYQLAGFWCPLVLPNVDLDGELERAETIANFQQSFPQLYPNYRPDPQLVAVGQPARADFLLWLTPLRGNKEDQILCLELSYSVPPNLLNDYRGEEAHRLEVLRYANVMESRGVFARVCAEVQGEAVDIPPRLASFLNGLISRDKPFYKLCQGAAYVTAFVKLLRNHGYLAKGCQGMAIAVTNQGLESIGATFEPHPTLDRDPRVKLMETLGEVYRQRDKIPDSHTDGLNQEIRGVFKTILKSLPKAFKHQVKSLLKEAPLGEDFQVDIAEVVTDFYQPMQEMAIAFALKNVTVTPELEQFFGQDPIAVIQTEMQAKAKEKDHIALRNAHAAAIIAGLKQAPVGEMRVIALEGNPGIGKTTAVIEFLRQQTQGFLFFYVSPRVVINREVTSKFSAPSSSSDLPSQSPGILTITSNAKLINAAPEWYRQQPQADLTLKKDGAVVVDGHRPLTLPQDSILYVTPEQEQAIDTEITPSRRRKQNLNDRTDRMTNRLTPGVLRTIATAAKKLLAVNPGINRVVLTAAIQGYRELTNGTTIDGLSLLFQHRANSELGKQERRLFAQKIPTVVAMVDEIAGDGAGALFCHKLADWLKQEFIDPFTDDAPAFRVILILADASLANEVVLDRYLNGGDSVPDKVLISPSHSLNASAPDNKTDNISPFQVTGTLLKVGNGKRKPTLHVMTNSFPATALAIDYRLRLSTIALNPNADDGLIRRHQLIRQQTGEELLVNAYGEIQRALDAGAEQVIFFAQDKRFLRDLKQFCRKNLSPVLTPGEIEILDQNVSEKQRLKLVQSPKREQVKVFLLTSSGSRGVSFPKADCIIALVPRFQVESSLMEIAQLIYRGRGFYSDPLTGEWINGDRRERRLVMLMQDFFFTPSDSSPSEPEALTRRWLRQTNDLFTLLVMLRSTIHTRITGDAGLDKKRLAFVPVGRVNSEELLHLMANDVSQFIYEAHIFVGDPTVETMKGPVEKANQLVQALFQRFDLTGKSPQSQIVSYAIPDCLVSLNKALTGGALVTYPLPLALQIPDNAYCLGSYWLEDWQDYGAEEQFNFSRWSAVQYSQIQQLLKLLWAIQQNPDLPKTLKTSAKELHHFLSRNATDADNEAQEYATLQATQSRHLAIAVPVDYAQFWQGNDGDRQIFMEEPILWRNALGRCLTDRQLIMPVIAEYDDFPWSAVVDKQAIFQPQLLFQKQYFVTSYELNLLNLILLENEP